MNTPNPQNGIQIPEAPGSTQGKSVIRSESPKSLVVPSHMQSLVDKLLALPRVEIQKS